MPSSPPLVSFAVMCYNTARYVGECLESLLAQEKFDDFEVVVIDDHSTDNTLAEIRRFKDSRIRVISHESNLGASATCAQVLSETRGKYVSRFDSDDRYHPNFLRTLVPILDRHPEVGLAYGDVAIIGPAGELYQERADGQHDGRDFKGNELVALLENNFICNPAVLARREAVISALPFPEPILLCDWHISTTVARRWELFYRHEVVADYRIHPGNIHSKSILDGVEERQIIARLDEIFCQQEASQVVEAAKCDGRNRIYGRNYLTLGDKYFGAGLYGEARRCYIQAMRRIPAMTLRTGASRRLLVTWIGKERYSRLKALLS